MIAAVVFYVIVIAFVAATGLIVFQAGVNSGVRREKERRMARRQALRADAERKSARLRAGKGI